MIKNILKILFLIQKVKPFLTAFLIARFIPYAEIAKSIKILPINMD